MSRLIAVLLLSMLMIPLAVVVYLLTFFSFMLAGGYRDEETMFLLSAAAAWAFIAAYWIALWRKTVTWTSKRKSLTGFSFLGGAAAGLVVGSVIASGLNSFNQSFAVFIGSIVAPLLWLVATIFVWRETAAERAERVARAGGNGVVCPTCGYNLTGLTGTRCPECGSEFTLDQLLATQPGKAAAELEV